MPSDKTKKGLAVAGILAAALLLGTAGTAKADEIIPPDDDIPPPPPPKPDPSEYGENWGGFPEGLRGPFLKAEKAATPADLEVRGSPRLQHRHHFVSRGREGERAAEEPEGLEDERLRW